MLFRRARPSRRAATQARAVTPGYRLLSRHPAVPGKRPTALKMTDPIIIAGGRYQLVRAPDHAETRVWHVVVGGRSAGLVRRSWRGERSRPRLGARRPVRTRAGRQGARRGHPGWQRLHPRRRRRSAARPLAPAGTRTYGGRPSNSPRRIPPRNARQSTGVNLRTGPTGSSLFGNLILPLVRHAASTQSPFPKASKLPDLTPLRNASHSANVKPSTGP